MIYIAISLALGCHPGSQLPPQLVSKSPPSATELANSQLTKQPNHGDMWKNSQGMTFVFIAPGDFKRGSPLLEVDRDEDEHLSKITISKGYWFGATEITRSEFAVFVTETGYVTHAEKLPPSRQVRNWRYSITGSTSSHPVSYLSWEDAKAFINWLSDNEGLSYRLPTEAEWEYACRAGTTTPYNTGEKLPEHQENFLNGNALTTAVHSFEPNNWGLYDMHGNVAEWCEDWYGPYRDGEITDPTGPKDGEERVIRGGGIAFHSSFYGRSAARFRGSPSDFISPGVGFRVVINPIERKHSVNSK